MSVNFSIPRPPDEAARLAAVRRYHILDTPPEADFDFLAHMAAKLCETPFAYVSLVDSDRVWYKSTWGRTVAQTPRDQDYCAWAILEDDGMHIADLTLDNRTRHLPTTEGFPNYRMYCGANLTDSEGHRIGAICVLDVVARSLDAETISLLRQLASQVMALIELRAKSRQLEEAYVALERLATIDELTGLFNRRASMEQLQNEIDRSRRSGNPFCFVMIDVDHFKKINDTYGHPCGDAVLREIGALLRQRIRSIDCAGRYGGEEMSLVLVNTSIVDAERIANQMREAIAATKFNNGKISASASFGVALFDPKREWTISMLVDAADKALFKAKNLGRNRVEVDLSP